MPLFIVKNNPGFKNPIVLDKEDEHHLLQVLRAKVGQTQTITDNHGQTLQVEIVSLKPLTFKILKKETRPAPSPVTVCLPLIDQTRLEWAIEKLCELNVATVQLITTDRTQLTDLSENKMGRLHKIALAAQKQCERAWPMEILDAVTLNKIKIDEDTLSYFGHVGARFPRPQPMGAETAPLQPETRNQKLKTIFLGPEGGFTDNELKFFEQRQVQPISLGHTILRTETAAVALVAVIFSPKTNLA